MNRGGKKGTVSSGRQAEGGDVEERDRSNGYDAVARAFVAGRNRAIGVETLRGWGRLLPPDASILDLGCGFGAPVAETLSGAGFHVYGIDASKRLAAGFRRRLPRATVACEPVEASSFFGRTFEGAVAIGLMFLLRPAVQQHLIHRVARALKPGGRFLFTAPVEACEWTDVLTGRASQSLGRDAYMEILLEAGLVPAAEYVDEGDNHYYDTARR